MKKLLFLIMVVMAASAVHAQNGFNSTTISGMQTFIGKPRNAWFPMDRGGVSYKIDINDIASNKLDTAFIRNDSFFTAKNGILKGTPIPGGNGNGNGGGGGSNTNLYNLNYTSDGHHLDIALYTGTAAVVGINIGTTNGIGSGWDSWEPKGDSVIIHYAYAPAAGTILYMVTVVGTIASTTGKTNHIITDQLALLTYRRRGFDSQIN